MGDNYFAEKMARPANPKDSYKGDYSHSD